MSTAPYGVRLLVGAAVTAIEETRKLPQTVMMYPMTVVSTLAQVVMKFQQDLADLAIKGDAALGSLFPPTEEQPDWATFDEDADGPEPGVERRTEGRFALYSVTDVTGSPGRGAAPRRATPAKGTRKATPAKAGTSATRATPAKGTRKSTPAKGTRKSTPAKAANDVAPPPLATELDYDELTLAQLRARMPALSVADLRSLLAYEEAGKARAPFVTLLANRITRATAR